MQRFDTHVCLVSAQAIPNLAPVLSDEFRPKKVILLVSREMGRQADAMEQVLKKYQITCDRRVLNDAYDIPQIQEAVLDLLVELGEESAALNVTGGTKPMAIAAQEAFRSVMKPVFYIHPDTNAVQLLSAQSAPVEIKSKIRLDDYLVAHGYAVKEKLLRQVDANSKRTELTETLIKDVVSFSNAIGKLNYLASMAEQRDIRRGREITRFCLEVDVTDDALNDLHWSKVIDLFANAGVLTLKGKTLRFADAEMRFYANGGWLEDYVFGIVKELPLQDAATNVLVENKAGSGGAENELDVAFLARNRLHLIECKARIFKDKDSKGAETLYKLDSLLALGGLNTRGMLVSYRTLRDADRQRAKDLRIKVVEADQLRGLKNQIQTWISQ